MCSALLPFLLSQATSLSKADLSYSLAENIAIWNECPPDGLSRPAPGAGRSGAGSIGRLVRLCTGDTCTGEPGVGEVERAWWPTGKVASIGGKLREASVAGTDCDS